MPVARVIENEQTYCTCDRKWTDVDSGAWTLNLYSIFGYLIPYKGCHSY